MPVAPQPLLRRDQPPEVPRRPRVAVGLSSRQQPLAEIRPELAFTRAATSSATAS